MGGKTALIVEGGGMRGIFAAGVLDAFLENGFDPFDLYIGVSAGACNLSSHLAGQAGRNHHIYTHQMRRPEFMNLMRFFMGGHFMDIDWLWDVLKEEYPLDVDTAITRTRDKEFIVVCTDVDTGKPVYLNPDAGNMLHLLKSSSSLPLLYRGFQPIDSMRVTDGGPADPVPAMEARRRGADKLVVIRSRPEGYVKKRGISARATSYILRKFPNLKRTIDVHADIYLQKDKWMAHPGDGIRIFQIRPSETFRTGRTTRDLDILETDYRAGVKAGKKSIAKISELFNI